MTISQYHLLGLALFLFSHISKSTPTPAKFATNIRRNWTLQRGEIAPSTGTSSRVATLPSIKGNVPNSALQIDHTKTGKRQERQILPLTSFQEIKGKTKLTVKYRPVAQLTSSSSDYESNSSNDSYQQSQESRDQEQGETSTSPKEMKIGKVTRRGRRSDLAKEKKRQNFLQILQDCGISLNLPATTLAERVFNLDLEGYSRDSIGTYTAALIRENNKGQIYLDAYMRRKRQLTNRSYYQSTLGIRPQEVTVKKETKLDPGYLRRKRERRAIATSDKMHYVIDILGQKRGINFDKDSIEDIERATRREKLPQYSAVACTRLISRYLNMYRGDDAALRYKAARQQAWSHHKQVKLRLSKG